MNYKNTLQAARLLFVALAVLSTSCKPGTKDPKETVQAFYEALSQKDFDKAEEYATPQSKDALDMMKSYVKMAQAFGKDDEIDFLKNLKNKKIEYSEPVMEGEDRARVSILADGKEEMPLILVKEKDEWKIAFDKATIMNTERSRKVDAPVDEEVLDTAINEMEDVQDSAKSTLEESEKRLDSLKNAIP